VAIKTKAPVPKSECDNCNRKWVLSDLNAIHRLYERMDPGGKVPDGECPDCGALCYRIVDERWDDDRDALLALASARDFVSQLSTMSRLAATICGRISRAIDAEEKRRREVDKSLLDAAKAYLEAIQGDNSPEANALRAAIAREEAR
jgi:hypothetical protein